MFGKAQEHERKTQEEMERTRGKMEHRNEFKKAVHIKENTRRHDWKRTEY